MKTTTRIFLTAGLMTTLMVSGCGSNNDEDAVATAPPASSTSVPDGAGVSATAFITYLMTLKSNDETSEPLTLGNSFAVPDEEASEPQPLV